MSRNRQTGRDADPRRAIPLNSHAWRKFRAQIIDSEPLCRHCKRCGRVTPATVVDHISGDPADNSLSNLQALCEQCHNMKTARGNNAALPGCNVHGIPADPVRGWLEIFSD
ncbi:HNH endonuclease signature motif containing protein [Xanthomonas sp. 3058]|uniref:HNH endonuclease signature motif containing protein n=1 Tax=Xanthomonas sp. 3058 TaxID=3035314 RepID=UPI001610083B|nr:HNH endonuclease signature motif containing protein [Xanthomonas sp. 3058]MBB5862420.1 5-methylcytosine-specific restriction endonuclease McrA [Xanthomonas sp. 3058]